MAYWVDLRVLVGDILYDFGMCFAAIWHPLETRSGKPHGAWVVGRRYIPG